MIKYKTGYSNNTIEKVEILRETDKCIWKQNKWDKSKEEREFKVSRMHHYWDTFDEAKRFLLERLEHRINSLTLQLEKAKLILKECNNLTK